MHKKNLKSLLGKITLLESRLLALKKQIDTEINVIVDQEQKKPINTQQHNAQKGAKCSVNGNAYEKKVHDIIKFTTHSADLLSSSSCLQFNTQNASELGGSKSINDLLCNFNGIKNIGIEVKKSRTPDWMQCSIKYNSEKLAWTVGTEKCKIPKESRNIFNALLSNTTLFNGLVPPFINANITHDEWIKIKSATSNWNDLYINVPYDTISMLYKAKGCYYVQISDGYGLYHFGHDICGFGVPEFKLDQQIRIRTKIHTRKNKFGFCTISVVAACQPKKIKDLEKSIYTLDDFDKLPKQLVIIENENCENENCEN